MPNFKFQNFQKGWFFKQQHLLGLDGFSDVNNFVIYKNAIEKIKGWQRLELMPQKYSDAIDTFNQKINDFNFLINSLNDSFLDPVTLKTITYPLTGQVQAIFPYIKFEEENIHLGTFSFDYIPFFGLIPGFNYNITFNEVPADESTGVTVYKDTYGIIYTCEKNCNLISIETVVGTLPFPSGPAFRVLNGSTKDNATLYALIYDPIQHTLTVGRWINSSVKTFDQILWSIPANYPVGTVLRVTEAVSGTYRIFVNDVQQFEVVDTTIDGTCFGMVEMLLRKTNTKPKQTNNQVNGLYLTSRFFNCDDGIVVTQNLLPQPDPDYDVEDDLTSDFDVTVKSGHNGDICYGILRTQLYSNKAVPNANAGAYFWADFVYEKISGNPRSGVFFRMDESKADPDDFTGWGIIIDGSKVFIAYWINQSLATYGTIHRAFDVEIPNGWGIEVEYRGQNATPALRSFVAARLVPPGEVGFGTFATITNPEAIIPAGAQGSRRQANTNVGIGWLGNDADGLHKARWTIRNKVTFDMGWAQMHVE